VRLFYNYPYPLGFRFISLSLYLHIAFYVKDGEDMILYMQSLETL